MKLFVYQIPLPYDEKTDYWYLCKKEGSVSTLKSANRLTEYPWDRLWDQFFRISSYINLKDAKELFDKSLIKLYIRYVNNNLLLVKENDTQQIHEYFNYYKNIICWFCGG